ncbi:amidohydrolase family protein [Streptomyces sp. YC504]|uniref:6-methylsalicylate decarboxylase n=1 Tax=Streptomyces mesophilus TaxID=1775132 RepID=A0A6G4XE23_9ACTN|nr:amidohydrolase family protein [Streptomyces mesophilus]NGO75785.1 amidohydrolase family protein [Streptomyces mesophilus]
MTGWLDVHAHYLTDHYAAACTAAGHGQPDGMPGLPSWSAKSALDVMDANGIAAAVLSISSPGVHFGDHQLIADQAARELAEHVNDAGAALVADHPERFGLSASLPLPDVDGALHELARAYDELHTDAVALKTHYHGRYLSDPAFAPVLAELDAREAVVTLHPTSPPGWECTALGRPRPMIEFLFDTTRCVVDLILSGTLACHPRIRWIIPHAGAVLPALAHRAAFVSTLTGEGADVPAALGSLYYDLAGTPVPVALKGLRELAAPERFLYGSDYPFTPAEAVTSLADALRRTHALHDARLDTAPGSPAARLFPRLTDTQISS